MFKHGDEQLDRPNSQPTMELYHAHVVYFLGFNINTTAFQLGPIQPSSPTTKELHGLR